MQKITNIIASRGGIVKINDMTGRAEYDRIRRAVERGDVVRLKQGVYAEPSAIINNMIDVERLVPGGIVCLYNAWSHYGLTTCVPPAFCIAIDANRKVIKPEIIPIQLYYWKKDYLSIGIEESVISGYHIKITDIERSVCDAVKYRNKIGIDICSEVVRNYLKRENRDISRLMDYAKKLRVAKTMNNYIEMLVE